MLAKIRFDTAAPIVARAGGRALIGSLNFAIVTLALQQLRRERFGTTVPEASGIDGLNEGIAEDAAAVEAARVREEQGYTAPLDPLDLAGKLWLIRCSVASDLEKHAQRRAMITDPTKTMPDPFHVGASIGDSIDFQLKTQPRVSEAAIRAEAKALNVAEQDIRDAVSSRHQRQLNFLRDSRDDVMRIVNALNVKGADGHALGLEADEAVFDTLPPITRLRCAASIDKGMFRARQRELELHMSGNREAAGNIALLDGVRRDILAAVGRWMEVPQFKAQLDEAMSRGASAPQFSPAPHVQQRDEREVALEKKAA